MLFELETHDYQQIHAEERTERPLARRLFALETFKRAYIERYRELRRGILSEDIGTDVRCS